MIVLPGRWVPSAHMQRVVLDYIIPVAGLTLTYFFLRILSFSQQAYNVSTTYFKPLYDNMTSCINGLWSLISVTLRIHVSWCYTDVGTLSFHCVSACYYHAQTFPEIKCCIHSTRFFQVPPLSCITFIFFFCHFARGNNCDFLFVSWMTKPFQMWSTLKGNLCSQGKKIFSWRLSLRREAKMRMAQLLTLNMLNIK